MKKIIKTTIKSVLYVLYYGIIAFLLYFVVAGRTLTDWYDVTFGTRFREIVYTFNLGLTGADTSFMNEALQECRPDLIKATVIVMLFVLADVIVFRRVGRRKVRVDEFKGQHDVQKETAKNETEEAKPEYRWVRSKWGYALRGVYHVTILLICIFLAKPVYAYADQVLQVSDFVRSKLTYTKIYDEKYVAPSSVQIQNTRKQKRNVIIIYMESMETTYVSKNLGGYQNHNLMPNLYNLQQENIAFGDRKGMAGTHNPAGTTWTTASILSSSSGIPFAFNMGMNKNEGNDADQGKFAKGITTLGDILEKQGYNQEFICGSDSTFGRKKKLFREHGSYKIFDYYSAIDAGYIDKDYKVWWGMEDFRTYEAAKDEILKLSEKDKPFNCTMLTVDTHHVGGYKCQKCPTGMVTKPPTWWHVPIGRYKNLWTGARHRNSIRTPPSLSWEITREWTRNWCREWIRKIGKRLMCLSILHLLIRRLIKRGRQRRWIFSRPSCLPWVIPLKEIDWAWERTCSLRRKPCPKRWDTMNSIWN